MIRDERAQALVEMALVLPVLLLILVGIFDLGRMVLYANTLDHAAHEGARYAITHGETSEAPSGPPPLSDAAIRSTVVQAATSVPNVQVAVSWPNGTNRRGDPVAVDARTLYVPTLSQYFLGGAWNVNLRGGSRMVIVR